MKAASEQLLIRFLTSMDSEHGLQAQDYGSFLSVVDDASNNADIVIAGLFDNVRDMRTCSTAWITLSDSDRLSLRLTWDDALYRVPLMARRRLTKSKRCYCLWIASKARIAPQDVPNLISNKVRKKQVMDMVDAAETKYKKALSNWDEALIAVRRSRVKR